MVEDILLLPEDLQLLMVSGMAEYLGEDDEEEPQEEEECILKLPDGTVHSQSLELGLTESQTQSPSHTKLTVVSSELRKPERYFLVSLQEIEV